MTTPNKALMTLVALFLIFCACQVIGLTIYFILFMLELVAEVPIALPIAIFFLIISILKVLAMQPK